MRTGIILAMAGATILLGAVQAEAFGTIGSLGQNVEHERVTRQGLAGFGIGPMTMDEIAGKRGTFGAVGAPDRPDRGLMSASEVHCDNGDWLDRPDYPRSREEARGVLESCRALIFAGMEQAVEAAGALVSASGDLAVDTRQASITPACRYTGRSGRAKCNVLENMGLAFHAAQDFYSHSNWVDPLRRAGARLEDPPGMGQASPIDWLDITQGDARFPDGLISGCYEGFPESRHCAGRVKHATLNKDTRGASRGQGGVYTLAMDVAAEDTRMRWAWFEQRVMHVYGSERGGRIVCVMRNDDPAKCRV
jgi:hypothetical protein